MPYRIEYSQDARDDLSWLSRRNQVRVQAEVRRLLGDQAEVESVRRKRLAPNPLDAQWELRLDDVRVLYDVSSEDATTVQTVSVLRVLEKRREQWLLRGLPIRMRL
jgi:mRNA-degrading endonuclease RelE of RelBE toxin-antitoxin system